MKTVLSVLPVTACLIMFCGCQTVSQEEKLNKFIDTHVEKLKPLEKEANLVSWQAETTGDQAAYDKLSTLRKKLNDLYSSRSDYAYLKNMHQSVSITAPAPARQADILYRSYLSNQIDPQLNNQIVDLSTEISRKFNIFRGTIDGREVTVNEILDVLRTETDSAKRQTAWQAGKQVGPVVAQDIIRLAKLRNQAAKSLGFDNFHTFMLAVGEQNVKDIDKIFAELETLTREPFLKLKTELDAVLAARYGISPEQLAPWHYQDPFFQEAPAVYDVDFDAFYKGKDIKALAAQFYKGIGLPVESILANSDLYEKAGKSPHAFCTNINREGDVRILLNIRDDEKWMEVALHELGHAVYDKYYDPQLPYLLRGATHPFTTEGIAMFFGRLSANPEWMQRMLKLTGQQRKEIETVSAKYAKLKQLIFARWAMVMYEFEKQLYANPDQDLNARWWLLVEKYQFVKPPHGRNEPDWASKIHIASTPCYYHNYMLGELFASQLRHHITQNVLTLKPGTETGFVARPRVGKFLREKVFGPASLYDWNKMITLATEEPLTAKYFVAEFVK